jgi:hypothetical protein
MARSSISGVMALVLALAAVPAPAADQGAGQQEMDMAALMEAYARYGTPGEHHRQLAERAGTFQVKVTVWPAPGAPPDVSEGTSERTLMMDGRYLMERFSGTTPMGPFQGIGVTGFDNIKQRFVAIWIDSMSTGIFTSESTRIGNNAVEYRGESPDPMTSSFITTRSVDTKVDANTFRYESYTPLPGGGEFKNMEIVYTRR